MRVALMTQGRFVSEDVSLAGQRATLPEAQEPVFGRGALHAGFTEYRQSIRPFSDAAHDPLVYLTAEQGDLYALDQLSGFQQDVTPEQEALAGHGGASLPATGMRIDCSHRQQ